MKKHVLYFRPHINIEAEEVGTFDTYIEAVRHGISACGFGNYFIESWKRSTPKSKWYAYCPDPVNINEI